MNLQSETNLLRLLKSHGVQKGSKDWHDYEYCKTYLYPIVYGDAQMDYDEFIRFITEYLSV